MSSKFKLLMMLCTLCIMSPASVSAADICTSTIVSIPVGQDLYQIVYLNNGTEIKGIVTEEDGMIKVKSVSGDIFYFSKEEIKEIYDPSAEIKQQQEKERIAAEKQLQKEQRRQNRMSSYYLAAELGTTITASSGKWSKMASISVINGYRICPWFQAGIGLDYSYLDYESSFAAYLNLKFPFLGRKKVSPFLSVDAGYRLTNLVYSSGYGSSYGMSEQGIYGIILSPAIGVQFNFNPKHSLALSFYYSTMFDFELNSIGLKLGYTFFGSKKN